MKTRAELAVTLHHFKEFIQEENSILSIVLKGQLLIEKEIESLINSVYQNASVLNLDRMFFPNKIDLLIAIGALSIDEGNTYKLFNKLRRKFAHNIEYCMSKENLDEVISSFTARHHALDEILNKLEDEIDIVENTKRVIRILLDLLLWQNAEDPEKNIKSGEYISAEEIEDYVRRHRNGEFEENI
ncbi:hypothetical protein [Paenibacillus paeoniae]|uniref:Uncharacterized protein n=1 Tax=Paenibacillus paeoniae TaxID=2292705 RepID=A0A371P8X2_9BACL|nr:hypothetical protein [Paenibacillus paeoniae]REK71978.1 hypothetical protein DX130_19995 [Paenibacillus paeoniae]